MTYCQKIKRLPDGTVDPDCFPDLNKEDWADWVIDGIRGHNPFGSNRDPFIPDYFLSKWKKHGEKMIHFRAGVASLICDLACLFMHTDEEPIQKEAGDE